MKSEPGFRRIRDTSTCNVRLSAAIVCAVGGSAVGRCAGAAFCRCCSARELQAELLLAATTATPFKNFRRLTQQYVVEPAYFHTVVRGLVLGESFSELHGTLGHEAAIVNHRFADVYLGAGSPIGHHLELGRQPPNGLT